MYIFKSKINIAQPISTRKRVVIQKIVFTTRRLLVVLLFRWVMVVNQEHYKNVRMVFRMCFALWKYIYWAKNQYHSLNLKLQHPPIKLH